MRQKSSDIEDVFCMAEEILPSTGGEGLSGFPGMGTVIALPYL
jgi:hypothetical protein